MIVRPVVFMDNTLRPWEKLSIVARSIFAYPAGASLAISWVALDDVATYMVKALSCLKAWYRSFVVGLEVLTGDHVEPESIRDRMGQFFRWNNAQPASPLAVDVKPLLEALPIQPPPFADSAKRQDWLAHAF